MEKRQGISSPGKVYMNSQTRGLVYSPRILRFFLSFFNFPPKFLPFFLFLKPSIGNPRRVELLEEEGKGREWYSTSRPDPMPEIIQSSWVSTSTRTKNSSNTASPKTFGTPISCFFDFIVLVVTLAKMVFLIWNFDVLLSWIMISVVLSVWIGGDLGYFLKKIN